MKTIKSILDNNSSSEVIESKMSDLISEKFDNELKSEWSQKLLKTGINREKINQKNGVKQKPAVWIGFSMLVIAAITIYLLSMQKEHSIQQVASVYISEDIYSHPDITKGESTLSESELNAGTTFNNKEWRKAQINYKQLSSNNPENQNYRFYLGLSYFYNNQFIEAKEIFEPLYNQTHNDIMRQELNWFYGLTLINTEELSKAKNILKDIHQNEWKFDEAQELINKIK